MRKVLNLYSGIGGNRKLWKNVNVVAVEIMPEIADIYKDFFPDDEIIIGDAHEFLLNNYRDFDFIWASPPCPTHSRTNYYLNAQGVIRYPDLKLYEEIILLMNFREKKPWVIENVISYYEPLIKPQVCGRHYYWSNFLIKNIKSYDQIGRFGSLKDGSRGKSKTDKMGFNLDKYKISKSLKEKVLRNCVIPEIGAHVFNSAFDEQKDKNLLNFQGAE